VRHEKDAENILKVIYISAVGVALAGLATATGIIDIKDGFNQQGMISSYFQYHNTLASYLGAVVFMGLYLWHRSLDRQKEAIKTARENIGAKLERTGLLNCIFAACNYIILAVLIGTKSRGGLLVFVLVFIVYLAGTSAEKRLTSILHIGYLGAIAFVTINKFIPLAMKDNAEQAWKWLLLGLVLALAGQGLFRFLDRHLLASWHGAPQKLNIAFGALAIFVIIAAGIWLSGHQQVTEKITSFDYLRNAFHRIYYMEYAVDMIKERLVLGWGGGGWQEAYQSFMDYRYTTRQVHSYYFQLGVETGILGVLIITGIWLSFLFSTHKLYHGNKKNPGQRQLIWTLAVIFLMIAGHAMIDFDLSLSALTLVLWSVFGMAAGLSRESQVVEEKAARTAGTKLNWVPLGAVSVTIILLLMGSLSLLQSRSLMKQGIALLQSGQRNVGLDYLERSIRYNPFVADYHITLSQVYSGLGEKEKAMAEARRAVKLSQYDIKPRINLTQIATASGRYDVAAEAVDKTIELAPNERSVYENVSQTYTRLGIQELVSGNQEEARSYFNKSVNVPVNMTRYWKSVNKQDKEMWSGPRLEISHKMRLYTGEAQYWLGEFTIAEQNLNEAVKDKNIEGEALMYLSLIKEKRGQNHQVEHFLKRASEISPGIERQYKSLVKLPITSKKTLRGVSD